MSAMSGTAANEVRRFVHAFSEGWRAPHPHAWDDLLADDLVLRQPLLPHRHGKAALAEEYARILQLLPDLRGKGTGWTASGPSTSIRPLPSQRCCAPRAHGPAGGAAASAPSPADAT
jgi:hypothetical protein